MASVIKVGSGTRRLPNGESRYRSSGFWVASICTWAFCLTHKVRRQSFTLKAIVLKGKTASFMVKNVNVSNANVSERTLSNQMMCPAAKYTTKITP